MSWVYLHRNFQEAERPNRSRRASTLNGQLPLERAAHSTKQSMVGALMRAALTQRESKQQSDDKNHATPDPGIAEYGVPKRLSMDQKDQRFGTRVLGLKKQ
jgi:hypothetical protein